MDEEKDDFEFERRFFCRSVPQDVLNSDPPTLIVQGYFVHEDNYALRIRLQAENTSRRMDTQTDALNVLLEERDHFTSASMTAKGPVAGGTRYEAERPLDPSIAAELVIRGSSLIVKNRYGIWLGEDWWNVDVFGGTNAPLMVAEVERSGPVTNLVIPSFCTTEITNDSHFSNDGLAQRPYSEWANEFEQELASQGSHFLNDFGDNRSLN
jgi:adenylate cyclase